MDVWLHYYYHLLVKYNTVSIFLQQCLCADLLQELASLFPDSCRIEVPSCFCYYCQLSGNHHDDSVATGTGSAPLAALSGLPDACRVLETRTLGVFMVSLDW